MTETTQRQISRYPSPKYLSLFLDLCDLLIELKTNIPGKKEPHG